MFCAGHLSELLIVARSARFTANVFVLHKLHGIAGRVVNGDARCMKYGSSEEPDACQRGKNGQQAYLEILQFS